MQNILFIGNSYTYYNDMPEQIFAKMAAEAGHPFEVTKITHGGYKLSQYANPQDEEGIRLRQAIKDKHFDYVVLQDHSCRAVVDKEDFFCGIRDLKALLQEQTDHFVLYATWGRKKGSQTLEELHLTCAEMTEKLYSAYTEAGEMFDMKVAHVGKAFAKCAAEHPETELFNPDLSHPSLEGSKLAAKTILATILS